MNKRKQLSKIFYFNFMVLIVIPILVIIIAAMIYVIKNSEESLVEKIKLSQNNVKTVLDGEIEDSCMSLSHFLLTNENQVLEYASLYNGGNKKEKQIYSEKLKMSYNSLFIPKADVLAVHFYMKDGSHYDLKDDLDSSHKPVSTGIWYQEALKNLDNVTLGYEKENILFARKATNKISNMMVIAFAPKKYDINKNIETVALYINPQSFHMIEAYKEWSDIGSMYLIDNEGNVIVKSDKENDAIIRRIAAYPTGSRVIKLHGEKLQLLIQDVANTNWKLITISKSNQLIAIYRNLAIGLISVSILLFILFYFFTRLFLKNILSPINHLVKGMEHMETGKLDTHVEPEGAMEVRKLIHSFNKMVRQIGELITSNEEKEKEKHQEEIKALQSQINPHFIVNTLNTIRFIAQASKYDSIKNMAESLIKILSCSFKSSNSFYTIREEIDILKSYVYLMKIRYSDNFDVKIMAEEDCMDNLIPRLLIQPIVENSISHGLQDKEDPGHISITIHKQGGILSLIVEDDGYGITEDKIKHLLEDKKRSGENIGISNVQRRIKLNYGEEYGISMESKPGEYTKTIIKIPDIQGKSEEKTYV
ncbi:histidine kinase [Anaerocolumna sp. AGMB13025]|uniref:sensor histidine kinase n=1 Tax=Anaerocolumna sp. AGMB13025 TaxID=3039116 RepID=UPI00241C8FC9|nr:histidine kinase [Anaerocolumna sp. AGMB13025]WFR58925.1 histidine kinase [Anaerocolumna sp. AGMB13025]